MKKATFAQIAAASTTDVNITSDAEKSSFARWVPGKPTGFSISPKEYPLSEADFGKSVSFSLPLDGDLIRQVYLVADLPAIAATHESDQDEVLPLESPRLNLPPSAANVQSTTTYLTDISPTAQIDWVSILYLEIDTYLAGVSNNVFAQEEVVSFLKAVQSGQDTLDTVINVANSNKTEIFDENVLAEALLGLIDLYFNTTLKLLSLIQQLLHPDRVRSVTEIMASWSVEIFSLDSESISSSSSALLSLLRDDLLQKLRWPLSVADDQLNLPDLLPRAASPGMYRDFLQERLEQAGYSDEQIEVWFKESLDLQVVEDITTYYRNQNVTEIADLHDEFVGETKSAKEVVFILTNTLKAVWASLLASTAMGADLTIPDSFESVVDTATVIDAVTMRQRTVLGSLSRQLFFNFINLSLTIKSFQETTTTRGFLDKLLVDYIPSLEAKYRDISPFFADIESIYDHAIIVFQALFPTAFLLTGTDDSGPLIPVTETFLLSYTWNTGTYSIVVEPGSYTIFDLNQRLFEKMYSLQQYVLIGSEAAFFMSLSWNSELRVFEFQSFLVPTKQDAPNTPYEFPTGFPYPAILPFAPQLSLSTWSPLGKPGTYGSIRGSSLIRFVAAPWATLLGFHIFVRLLGQEYGDYSTPIRDFLVHGEELDVDPYLTQQAFAAYMYPIGPRPPNDYDAFKVKHAMIGDVFLEEMYCEYVGARCPQDWRSLLARLSANWDLAPYDRQVLLSYHLEGPDEISERSARVGWLITLVDLEEVASVLGISRVLRTLLTLTEYIEYIRTNEAAFDTVYQEWERKVAGQRQWKYVQALPYAVPATVIEEHYLLNDTPLGAPAPPEGPDPLEQISRALVSINGPFTALQEQITFTPGRYDGYDLRGMDMTFLGAAAVYTYSARHFWGTETEYLWDGEGDPPIMQNLDDFKSLLVLPFAFRRGGGGYYKKYKGLWIVDPMDAMPVCPDVVDGERLTFPVPEIVLKYEELRWRILGDFGNIHRGHAEEARPVPTRYMPGSRPSLVAWRSPPGSHLVSEAAFADGDRVIESIGPAWQILSPAYLDARPGSRRSLDKMLGFTPELTTLSPRLPPTRLIIPLRFWFSRDNHSAFPLVSTAYANVRLLLRLARLEDLLIYQTPPETTSRPSFSLLVDYVYLAKPERSLFVTRRHFYTSLISKSIRYKQIPARLCLEGPVADIFVFFIPSTDAAALPARALPVAKTLRLVVNGNKDNAVADAAWWSLVEPHARYPGPSLPNVHVFPFALYPAALQPSGSLNFDATTDCRLEVEFVRDSRNLDMVLVYRTYAILQVASGMLSVLY